MIYVSSGSCTDHGEPGNEPNKSTEGEDPNTSCIWRLDPKADHPKLEIFADGLRNPFGFCWNDKGEFFATENGPNADPPEELNRIEQGKHYGFPFRFSNWPNKVYPDEPDGAAEFSIRAADHEHRPKCRGFNSEASRHIRSTLVAGGHRLSSATISPNPIAGTFSSRDSAT